MQNNIFIPQKIKVGFQERSDTYTQKLAYVIYYDEKGKLRKETSWESWRDKKIDPVEFDNAPTSGFVLNKKVGGYKSDWNFRNAYVRIYDPRDFEFEITIPNLLFILENTNSIKGKGLEGEFVYGWQGSDLFLIPTSCPDYVDLSKYNDLRHSKSSFKSKDLILGATYLFKDNTNKIYMGRFNRYDTSYHKSGVNKGLEYFFMSVSSTMISTYKSLGGNILEVTNGSCVENFAELIEEVESCSMFSPVDDSKDEYVEFTLVDFIKRVKENWAMVFVLDGKKYKRWQISIYNRHYSACDNNSRRTEYTTVDEMYNKLKPHYLNKYLSNGKLYRSTKNDNSYY